MEFTVFQMQIYSKTNWSENDWRGLGNVQQFPYGTVKA